MANRRREVGKRFLTVSTFPSACKKISFTAKADARRWLKKKRGQDHFSSKHAYACEKCGGWHVTSQPQSGNPRNVRRVDDV